MPLRVQVTTSGRHRQLHRRSPAGLRCSSRCVRARARAAWAAASPAYARRLRCSFEAIQVGEGHGLGFTGVRPPVSVAAMIGGPPGLAPGRFTGVRPPVSVAACCARRSCAPTTSCFTGVRPPVSVAASARTAAACPAAALHRRSPPVSVAAARGSVKQCRAGAKLHRRWSRRSPLQLLHPPDCSITRSAGASPAYARRSPLQQRGYGLLRARNAVSSTGVRPPVSVAAPPGAAAAGPCARRFHRRWPAGLRCSADCG